MELDEIAFNRAQIMVESGIIKLSEEMDIFQLTELLLKLENEREYKNLKSDKNINFNDEIVFIEDVGILDTVDISVSGDNLFYCNSILTKNSFGLPATADFMFALISTDELEELDQIIIKQLKNRYGDSKFDKKFPVGIDKSKMKLYDLEDGASEDLINFNDIPKDDSTVLTKFRDSNKKLTEKFGGFTYE